MKLTDEQKHNIIKELDIDNQNGILYRIIYDLTKTFQPFARVIDVYPYSRTYEINSEELEEFTRDIKRFEEDGEYWEYYRLYEYHEEEDDEVLYFDFNRDIVPVISVIRDNIKCYRQIELDMCLIRDRLQNAVDAYLKQKIGVQPGYYCYYKDRYGDEYCEYIGDYVTLRKKSALLDRITSVHVVTYIDKTAWEDIYSKRDIDLIPEAYYQNHAIKKALKDHKKFPFYVITHPTQDSWTKYEIRTSDQGVDYDTLIQEYAKNLKYEIEPVFVKGIHITAKEAQNKGMLALAKKIEKLWLDIKNREESNDQTTAN